MDLLQKFAHDLSFDFKLVRVKDGNWGGVVNGQWNGLVAELINGEADLVMTSLKINSGRETVIAFSVPFLETGITILVGGWGGRLEALHAQPISASLETHYRWRY